MTPELKAACEAIFQEHKMHSVSWARDFFRGRISTGMLDLAKEVLLEKNMIYYPNPAKKVITMLNPDVSKAVNFEEAIAILSGKLPVPGPAIALKKTVIAEKKEPLPLTIKPPVLNKQLLLPEADENPDKNKWYLAPSVHLPHLALMRCYCFLAYSLFDQYRVYRIRI